MSAKDQKELWEELEAMDEMFVRRKHSMGGYSAPEDQWVEEWLTHVETMRQQSLSAQIAKSAVQSASWAKVGAIAACLAALATLLQAL
ncbi:hypothetical protein [Stenotrophomonas sp. TD3]|uniref:hypothetical protein n=1 Tax=Stenotrophomonas sp. TD3 TaxID=1641707 RepID=UPI0011153AF0|nr:hypothetical protein [Stenotrophomonas sp. TD3]